MPFANTATRYGSVAKTLHWLTAILIGLLIPTGMIANRLPYDTAGELAWKAQLFSLHKTLGVLLFTVALLRILWALSQPKPAPLHPGRRVETFLADSVHWLLYGTLVLVPLTGWISHAASEGFAPILLPIGQDLPLVPKSETLATLAAGLHITFERLLLAALLLHIAGALKHHVADRDVTLRRMWYGSTEGGKPAARAGKLAPLAGAIAAVALAIGIGAWAGLFETRESPANTVALGAVESDWQVESGSLAIKVTQFGSDITGAFADWTAAITFDETAEGAMGDVEVTVAIPSLSLGSSTEEAMKPDWFDAAAHPTARFVAGITRAETGYRAIGTLTLKGRTVPVTLPFTLTIRGDRATMAGTVTLDRRDFGIGDASETAIRHPVEVSVDLVASRGGG